MRMKNERIVSTATKSQRTKSNSSSFLKRFVKWNRVQTSIGIGNEEEEREWMKGKRIKNKRCTEWRSQRKKEWDSKILSVRPICLQIVTLTYLSFFFSFYIIFLSVFLFLASILYFHTLTTVFNFLFSVFYFSLFFFSCNIL